MRDFNIEVVNRILHEREKLQYELYLNEDYWEFVPKEQKLEMQKEGTLPNDVPLADIPHLEREMSELSTISDTESIGTFLGKRRLQQNVIEEMVDGPKKAVKKIFKIEKVYRDNYKAVKLDSNISEKSLEQIVESKCKVEDPPLETEVIGQHNDMYKNLHG